MAGRKKTTKPPPPQPSRTYGRNVSQEPTSGLQEEEAATRGRTEADAAATCSTSPARIASPDPNSGAAGPLDYLADVNQAASSDGAATITNQPQDRLASAASPGGSSLVQTSGRAELLTPASFGHGQATAPTSTISGTSATGPATAGQWPQLNHETVRDAVRVIDVIRRLSGLDIAGTSSLLSDQDPLLTAGNNAASGHEAAGIGKRSVDQPATSQAAAAAARQYADCTAASVSSVDGGASSSRQRPLKQEEAAARIAPKSEAAFGYSEDKRPQKGRNSGRKKSPDPLSGTSSSSSSSSESSDPKKDAAAKKRGRRRSVINGSDSSSGRRRERSSSRRRDRCSRVRRDRSNSRPRRRSRGRSGSSSSSAASSGASHERSRPRRSSLREEFEARARMKAIDKFEGKPGEDAAHWVNEFERAVRGQSGEAKYFEFKKAMTGQAKDWMKRQIDSDTRNKKEASSNRWCRRLKDEFKIEEHHLERMEFACRQKIGQDAREYVQKKLDLIGRTYSGFSESRKVRRLLEGVHPLYYNHMAANITLILQLAKIKKCDVTKVFTNTLEEQMVLHENVNGNDVFFMRGEGGQLKEPPIEEAAASSRYPKNSRYDTSRRRAEEDECFSCYAKNHRWADCPNNTGRLRERSRRDSQMRPHEFQQQWQPVFQQWHQLQYQWPLYQDLQPPQIQYHHQPPQGSQPQIEQSQASGGLPQQPAASQIQQQTQPKQLPQVRPQPAIMPGNRQQPHQSNLRPW